MSTMRRLLMFLREPRKLVALAVGLGWATTVSWAALISTSAYLISAAALHPSVAELQVAIVGVRFFGISRAVFRYLERLVSHTVTFRVLAGMRTWLYERIEPLVPAGLGDQKSSDLYSRMAGDIEILQDFYVRVAAPPLVALLSSMVVLGLLGFVSIEMALVLLVFQVLTGVVTPVLVRKWGASSSRMIGQGRAELADLIVDGVQGSADIQAFGLEEQYASAFSAIQEKIDGAERKQNILNGAQSALVGAGVNLSAFLILLTAIPMVDQGVMDGRLLAVVVLGALASFESIMPLPSAFQNLGENIQVGESLFELADRVPAVVESGDLDLERLKTDLRIENLAFAYSQSEKMVIAGFNLDLPQGKKTAILGPSGVGKTTILNLLLRLWPVEEGTIWLNGIDILAYRLDEIRQVFSYVPQNPYVFNASISENVRIGYPAATEEEIFAALEKAGLKEFIEGLPDGLATLAGEYGVMLSGGQRQRLVLARALVREAAIFLLDEPTENLDPATAAMVLESFFSNMEDKSVLMITHQFYGLEKMDEIIVMQDHKAVERGTHTELLGLNGYYAQLVAENKSSIE